MKEKILPVILVMLLSALVYYFYETELSHKAPQTVTATTVPAVTKKMKTVTTSTAPKTLPGYSENKIYSYVDSKGVKRYSNVKPDDDSRDIKVSDEIPYRPQIVQNNYPNHPNYPDKPISGVQNSAPAFFSSASARQPVRHYKKRLSDGIFEVNGYNVNVTGHQRGRTLDISGRVSGGPSCGTLFVSGIVHNRSSGRSQSFSTVLSDVGGSASRIISCKASVWCRNDQIIDTWTLSDVSVSCQSQ